MRPVNPYIVGNPIKDQANFFGRQDIFREVLQVLRQRGSNAIVLYGQRRIGKTSVLLQLKKQLADGSEFTPVYFDLQDKAAKSLSEVLYELAQHIAKVTGHTNPQSSEFDKTGDYFRGVFLPEIAERIATGGLVLLFDEFDVLDSPMDNPASEAFFPYLSAWMADVQKVKFVFVIGRRPEDLSVRTMSTFKGIQSTRVSFLSMEDAEDVIRQSENNSGPRWGESGVRKVLELTHGHPYFTQLLCSVIWENVNENDVAVPGTPTISEEDVDCAVSQALKFGANAFNWLWDGFPPAERVIVAAMAEVQEEIITQDRLVETLNRSGVRLVARELEFAPETLIDWEILIESDGAYRFAVPLLRSWVLANRPLRRVKEELDRINPLADGLYQTGYGYYARESPNLEAAAQQLQQAININPNHLKARLLLGQILLEKGNFIESVNMLEPAYQYDERAARGHLIRSLLALAESQDENLQLATYQRILKLQSDQPLANEKIRAIWFKRAEVAQAAENYEEAVKAYEQIGETERIEKVHALMHEKKLALDMQRAGLYEKSGQWKLAIDTLTLLMPEYPGSETLQSRLDIARINWHAECLPKLEAWEREENWTQIVETCDSLEKDFPDDAEIRTRGEHARVQLALNQKYIEALNAEQNGRPDQARQILSNVLVEDPTYLQAAIKLIETTYGKISILLHVPLGVHFIAFIGAIVWTLIILLATSGMIAEGLANYYAAVYRTERLYIYRETFLLLGVVLTPLVGVLLGFYANNVIEIAYKVKPQNLSYLKAFWTHFIFGMGLFYADRKLNRKWLYPVLALLTSFLILAQVFYELTGHMSIGRVYFETMAEGRADHILEIFLSILLGLYAISYVDVMIACYQQRMNDLGSTNKMWKTGPKQMTKEAYPKELVPFEYASTPDKNKDPINGGMK